MIKQFRDEYRWLSNFWNAPINIDGHLFQSTEHYYQAMKMTNEQDFIAVKNHDFKGLKELANSLPLDPNWDFMKDNVMKTALRAKFTQHPVLREKLIATDDEFILEGNYWHDNYWGDCACKDCDGEGENRLGYYLMDLREELSNE